MLRDFIYLASASPRRRALLDQIGVPYRVRTTVVDESTLNGEPPERLVERLALEKARAVGTSLAPGDARPVLAADTTVVLDGDILGKPHDREDGLRMLERLSGARHHVLTAVALVDGEQSRALLSHSQVEFRELDRRECEAYWETGEPADKAGSYAIQGMAAIFITHLVGSYSGVMGLPLFEAAELLREVGVDPLCGERPQ